MGGRRWQAGRLVLAMSAHTWQISSDGGLFATCTRCGAMHMVGGSTERALRKHAVNPDHAALLAGWLRELLTDSCPNSRDTLVIRA
jgi:hypothetical protein